MRLPARPRPALAEHRVRPELEHGEDLLLAQPLELHLLRCGGAPARHHLVEEQLLLRPLQNALLRRPLANQAVHVHRLGLPDAVHAVHRLEVHLRVTKLHFYAGPSG